MTTIYWIILLFLILYLLERISNYFTKKRINKIVKENNIKYSKKLVNNIKDEDKPKIKFDSSNSIE